MRWTRRTTRATPSPAGPTFRSRAKRSASAIRRSSRSVIRRALPVGSLGADIAVDTVRAPRVRLEHHKNQLEAFDYGATMSKLPPVSVGAQPWGMAIDNSGSLLLVANSGGTNISRVDLRLAP